MVFIILALLYHVSCSLILCRHILFHMTCMSTFYSTQMQSGSLPRVYNRYVAVFDTSLRGWCKNSSYIFGRPGFMSPSQFFGKIDAIRAQPGYVIINDISLCSLVPKIAGHLPDTATRTGHNFHVIEFSPALNRSIIFGIAGAMGNRYLDFRPFNSTKTSFIAKSTQFFIIEKIISCPSLNIIISNCGFNNSTC